jgi:hypothetical protein
MLLRPKAMAVPTCDSLQLLHAPEKFEFRRALAADAFCQHAANYLAHTEKLQL